VAKKLALNPLELIHRLAQQIPDPRRHLVCYSAIPGLLSDSYTCATPSRAVGKTLTNRPLRWRLLARLPRVDDTLSPSPAEVVREERARR